MKKIIKFILIFVIILLANGCAEIELPPEGSKCSWYINDTYENANWLFYAMENMINLDENPSVNFWYNSTSDYGVDFTGLKSDVDVEIYDNISGDGTYEITLCNDSGCARLSFNFDSHNIKQSSGGGNCPYPTLYYDLGSEAIQTFYFSTVYSSTDFAFINIFNSKVDSTNPDEPVNPDVEEPNWCSTFFRIEDQLFNNDTNLILYFWQKEDGLYYAVKKIDGDIELTNENVGQYSEFNTNYSWQSVKDELTYYDEVNSTTFTLVEFSNMDNVVSYDGDKLICSDGYTQQSTSGATTGDYDGASIMLITGQRYKKLLGSLKMPLSMLYGLPLNFTLQVGDNPNFIFENIEANNDLCSNFECIDNANYYVEKGLKNIRSYCNDMYSKYEYYKYSDSIDDRMNECISFNQFYSQLVNEGIVNDLADYCGILSEDFVKKLSFVLNIIMIAGPILAILLGTVDFIKVIANGDADKEMKTAFKHFMIRVGSAALLFIVPLLLSFILNIFMANEGGYDPENPFCNVNDWSE